MHYHAPHVKAHEKASSKRRRFNKKKNKFGRSKSIKLNNKLPEITFDRKPLDKYTLQDFEKALCMAINVKILPELSDVVDSFLKRRSVGLKIRAIMRKNLRSQVEGIVKDSIDQAVKEVVNDLRSFDMFSLSLSKAKIAYI